MTDYQRLVDFFMDEIPEDSPFEGKIKYLVEKLLTEGVTFQKWIPVTERLPEDDLPKDSNVKQIKVFVAYKTNGRWVTRTQIRAKGYFWGDKDWSWVKMSDPISHWMPLPEPPKE